MANIQNGNTFYIDTQSAADSDDLQKQPAIVTQIIITATGANGRVVLADLGNNPAKKLDLRVVVSGETQHYFFDTSPVVFPSGIKALILTNAIVTVVLKGPGG